MNEKRSSGVRRGRGRVTWFLIIAERVLATNQTKNALEDQRIATDKIRHKIYWLPSPGETGHSWEICLPLG